MQANKIGTLQQLEGKENGNNADAKRKIRPRPHYSGLSAAYLNSRANLLLCELYAFESQGKWVW